MAVDNVEVSSSVDSYGNSYTSAISNDALTNEDFLNLMIEELKNQDPTKPMDTAAMMDNQLKMSTIESNLEMSQSMEALRASYANSALSTAANLIGHVVENGEMGDDGLLKSYEVETVENIDGELYVNARQMTGVVDGMQNTETGDIVRYDANGYFYPIGSEEGSEQMYQLVLDSDGRFTYNDDGTLKMNDENGNLITDETILSQYAYAASAYTYAEETSLIPLNTVMKVR